LRGERGGTARCAGSGLMGGFGVVGDDELGLGRDWWGTKGYIFL